MPLREEGTQMHRVREKHDGQLEGPRSVGLWLRLLTCSTVIEKRLRRRFEDRFKTTLPRFDVMAALDRAPDGLTMGQLSRKLLVSNGNVTALVRQLNGQGLVSSTLAADDRRTSIVALTDKGRRDFAELAEAHRGWVEAILAGMPAERQNLLFDLLAELKGSIGSERIEDEE
jgi:DNA-binding MarR family transcriptional regulator